MDVEARVAVITDNLPLGNGTYQIIQDLGLSTRYSFDFFCSPNSSLECSFLTPAVEVIDVNLQTGQLINNYDVILSIHCMQIFPVPLVRAVRCANLHPGLNPFNRGWYPQVFSILNGKPWGATFHEIDEQLDHGRIISQVELQLESWDTSYSAYQKVLDAELLLLRTNLTRFLKNEYQSHAPRCEGNVNLIKDFRELCTLDLEHVGSLREHLDLLRALTHPPYRNAFFLDTQTGEEVYVSIELERTRSLEASSP